MSDITDILNEVKKIKKEIAYKKEELAALNSKSSKHIEEVQKAIGNVIKKERNKQKLSQVELAEISNTNDSLISHIEQGKANPTISTLIRICISLGITIKIPQLSTDKLTEFF